jgi:hypothetical protein
MSSRAHRPLSLMSVPHLHQRYLTIETETTNSPKPPAPTHTEKMLAFPNVFLDAFRDATATLINALPNNDFQQQTDQAIREIFSEISTNHSKLWIVICVIYERAMRDLDWATTATSLYVLLLDAVPDSIRDVDMKSTGSLVALEGKDLVLRYTLIMLQLEFAALMRLSMSMSVILRAALSPRLYVHSCVPQHGALRLSDCWLSFVRELRNSGLCARSSPRCQTASISSWTPTSKFF